MRYHPSARFMRCASALAIALLPSVSNAGGRLDPSFGDHGRALIDCGSIVSGLALDSRGRIDFVGATRQDIRGDVLWVVGRLIGNGKPDATFGCALPNRPGPGIGNVGTSIAIRADGRILSGGYGELTDFYLVSYLSNGKPDLSFGRNGLFYPRDFSLPYLFLSNLALDAQGRILSAGTALGTATVIRQLPNGTPDQSFGDDAVSMLPAPAVTGLRVQPDGRILVATTTSLGEEPGSNALMRLLPNGDLDPGFGVGGIVEPSFPGRAVVMHDLLVQPDGKIVLIGEVLVSPPQGFTYSAGFAVARFTSEGVPDSTFGQSGTLVFRPRGKGEPRATAGVVQQDGKIVLVGSYDDELLLARLTNRGKRDLKFGRQGVLVAAVPGNWQSLPFSAALQSDGKLVVAGRAIDRDRTEQHTFFMRSLFTRFLLDEEEPPRGDVTPVRPSRRLPSRD